MAAAPARPGNSSPAAPPLRLSVVVPVYNEVDNVEELVDRLAQVTRSLGEPAELILVDDGSRDGTAARLHELTARYPELRALELRRNFGQSAAMTAGFEHARGQLVVSLDGDLQNPPEEIPKLVAKLRGDDLDIVCGWRQNRQDKWLSRKLPSKLANKLIGALTGVRLRDYGCSLKAYRRDLVEDLILYGELHRFIPVLASIKGARIAEIPVEHAARTRGASKYGIGRLPKVLLDLGLMLFFQRFATRPLHFFGRLGGLCLLIGIAVLAYLTGLKLFLGEEIGGRPLLLLGVLLTLTGVLLGSIGLLAELMVRTLHESSGKRIYSVRREMP